MSKETLKPPIDEQIRNLYPGASQNELKFLILNEKLNWIINYLILNS